MDEFEITREVVVPAEPERVWETLSEPDWLPEDAAIDLRPDGDVRAGDREGFVESIEEPRRLTFWWCAEGEESTRVEIELLPDADGTRVRVVETRPLAALDLVGPDFALPSAPRGPELLATV